MIPGEGPTEKSVILRDESVVEIYGAYGSDQMICEAARVSTLGTEASGTEESQGLINYLMRSRHGSPFEHGALTFRIESMISVWREFMRHRIGFSYNEESGRYKILNGHFYIPPPQRPLVQEGKPSEYTLVEGTPEQYENMQTAMTWGYRVAWDCYQAMLEEGIAKEVARQVLPVGTFSTAYVTCNPRSLMSFLSLRTKVEGSIFPSNPMWEINQVANAMEREFERFWPLTHAAFVKFGRVAP